MTLILGPLPCHSCGRIVYVARGWGPNGWTYLVLNTESHDIHACPLSDHTVGTPIQKDGLFICPKCGERVRRAVGNKNRWLHFTSKGTK